MRRIQDVIDSPDRSEVYKTMAEPRIGSMCITWLPLSFSSGPWAAPQSAPSLGQHTSEVLQSLARSFRPRDPSTRMLNRRWYERT